MAFHPTATPRERLIVVQTRFSAVHCWPDCPHDDVGFLRNSHRHEFHVTLKLQVSHDNRELEFLQVKKTLDTYVRAHFHEKNLQQGSCEMIAESIAFDMNNDFNNKVKMVSVFEDGENGAEVYY
jgi:hypothetical protein